MEQRLETKLEANNKVLLEKLSVKNRVSVVIASVVLPIVFLF
ncbi:putative uncharacterized domain protein (plasmid) [Borreliella bissettiae DN127]|uniref:Uncharacterized domain protein n=1 Tax=Borrelia bissettiae (strain DSM 17990 / CIP 109136 / DN127) TaxID=521010 RepID=G0APB8_BORBD|nr:putative uncharacterized domain protein [Borreliella bissettiae DN127]